MGDRTRLKWGVFSDVRLLPPENRLTQPVKAGLAFPEDYPAYARHQRFSAVADTACGDFPAEAKRLEGTYIWGGFALHHFGHFIAEALSRLWVADEAGHEKLPVLFLISPENPVIKPYVEEVLAYFGFDNYQIETEPVIAETLVIGEMGKQMGSRSHPDYIGWLAARQGKRLQAEDSPEKLCVLRGHFSAGNLVGEKALEKALEQARYFCLKPEDYSIEQQLRFYANAKYIVFSEGSAIHMVDLLPALKADVVVLNRRPLSVLAETSLRQKAGNLYILKDVARVMSPRAKGRVGFNRALSHIPFQVIETCLNQHGFMQPGDWPEDWSRYAALEDAVAFDAFLSAENLPDDTGLSLEKADAAVNRLMGEVAFHFDLVRQLRYKMWVSRATLALEHGQYETAEDYARRALRQYAEATEATAILEKAQAKRKKVLNPAARLLDRISRAWQLLWSTRQIKEVQLPE